jgi:hypothetical protein
MESHILAHVDDNLRLGMSARSEPWSSIKSRPFLVCVMEDNAGCMPLPRAQAANAMPQINAIGTARSLNRTMMHCERYAVTLP